MKTRNTQQDLKEKQTREEFIKQSKEIEKMLLPNGESFQESPEELEEAYKKMKSYLKESGVYQEDSLTSSRKADAAARSSRGRRAIRVLSKCAVIAIICGGSLFALSMRSEANREYFMDTVNYLIGNDTQIDIGTEEGDDKKDLSEDKARARIEEELGVQIPKFSYRPKEMQYAGYEIDTQTGIATIEYRFEEKYINLYIANNKGKAIGNTSPHGEEVDNYIIKTLRNEIEVEVNENKEDTDTKTTYIASWKYGGCYYQLAGKLEKADFIRTVERIWY